MSAPTPDPLSVLADQLADSPAGRLLSADRRREGQALPTIPVPGAPQGVAEVDYEVAAYALFEMRPLLRGDVRGLATDRLTRAVTTAVRTHGIAALRRRAPGLPALAKAASSLAAVAESCALAWRLMLTFWYEGARSRPLTAGEVAACLYRAPTSWTFHGDALEFHDDTLYAAVREGIEGCDGTGLVRAGQALRRAAVNEEQAEFPDVERARICLFLAACHTPELDTPLVVQPDPGSRLGTAPLLGAWMPTPIELYGERPDAWRW